MTTATQSQTHRIEWNAEDETFDVIDPEGDVVDWADTRRRAERKAAGLDAELRKEEEEERAEELRGEIEARLADASLATLEKIAALLK